MRKTSPPSGGEFEFVYVQEDGGNLVFRSKSDLSDVTTLTFEPALSGDTDELATTLVSNLAMGFFHEPDFSEVTGLYVPYQYYSGETDVSVFMTFDLDNRNLHIGGATEGSDFGTILSGNSRAIVDTWVPFVMQGNTVLLENTVSYQVSGNNYELASITVGEDTSNPAVEYCDAKTDSLVRFTNGSFELTNSLFSVYTSFQDEVGDFYSVNYPFIFDGEDNSLDSAFEAYFEGVAAFQWYIDLELQEGVPSNVLGFVTVDESDNVDFYLRYFNYGTNGNYIELELLDSAFVTASDSLAEFNNLMSVTDEIFSGGSVFAIETGTIDGLYELYNPCNDYTVFLVE